MCARMQCYFPLLPPPPPPSNKQLIDFILIILTATSYKKKKKGGGGRERRVTADLQINTCKNEVKCFEVAVLCPSTILIMIQIINSLYRDFICMNLQCQFIRMLLKERDSQLVCHWRYVALLLKQNKNTKTHANIATCGKS